MKRTLLLVFTSLLSTPAWAYLSTIDTGDLVPEGKYQAIIEGQFVTDPDSGANFIGRVDGSIDDETGWRGLLGFGDTDFEVGGFIKWIPIPDFEDQPALGALAGVTYARESSDSELAARIHPLISKRFGLELGDITPYASLPFGLHSRGKKRIDDDGDVQDKTFMTLQLAAGVKFRPSSLENWSFGGELGFSLSEANTYFSLFAALNIDPDEGVKFK